MAVSEVVISGYKNTSSHGVQINCIVRPTLPYHRGRQALRSLRCQNITHKNSHGYPRCCPEDPLRTIYSVAGLLR